MHNIKYTFLPKHNNTKQKKKEKEKIGKRKKGMRSLFPLYQNNVSQKKVKKI